MIRLAHPWVFWLEIPLLLLWFEVLRRQFPALARLRENTSPLGLATLTVYGRRTVWVHQVFLLLLGQLLLAAAAGPYRHAGAEAAPSGGVVIALDASVSMYAEDAGKHPHTRKPFRNRFEQARAFAADLVDALPGTPVGLVSYSGAAVLHAPPTLDHAALKELIAQLSFHAGDASGSDFTRAFDTVIHLVGRERKPYRVVLVGDGEMPRRLDYAPGLDLLVKNGVTVFTVGVGTADGAGVVVYDPEDVRRGADNPTVIRRVHSHRDDDTLEAIADRTGGGFFPISDGFWADTLAPRLKGTPGSDGAGPGTVDLSAWPLGLFLAGFGVETLLVAALYDRRRKGVA
ncbi:MAG: VWA domain-containing protein [Acidobacteria bacterium]|nr:VWA domain-containing protein [Acidobacteriota bacterium]